MASPRRELLVAGALVVALALVAFVIVGNPATGAAFSRVMIPGFWHDVGFWLPPGAGVWAVTGAVYFSGNGSLGALGVLSVYAAAGGLVAVVLGGRRRPRSPDAELASAAAAA